MVLAVGTVIAGYRIEEVLGAGGMGTVYRAAHPSLPRSDALKVLSAELSLNPQFRARFLREADLAATLDHPNIIAVYNRGESDDGLLWIAMQYVAGSDAGKELQAGRMTPQRALHIVAEVGKALDYAHRRSVLHRDVKPANFLLAGGDERVLLADFGIARAVDDAAGLTETGMVMGSMAYSPPEMLNGGELDARADIYSLGCSLYKLLTGRAPFGNGAGMAAMATGHMMSPPPHATAVAPWLPPGIDAVIVKAMAKDRAQRYGSAEEFVGAATAALHDGQITTPIGGTASDTREWRTPPPAPPPPPPPPVHRDPFSYPGGPFAGPPLPAAEQGRLHPPPPVRRGLRHRWVLAVAVIVTVIAITAGIATVFLLSGDDEPRYQPQTLRHTYGSTELTSRPRAAAALGPGDADAVLSLGVQPVIVGAPDGRLPGYEQRAVTGKPQVVAFTDTGAVAGAHPDVVIDTGDIDRATYDKLAAIAPTVTRPPDQSAWSWQDQLKWVGRILGREPTAQELINMVRTQLDDLRNQHSAFNGKTIEAVTVSDTGVSEVLFPSRAADYLEALGFRYNDDLQRKPTDTGSSRPVAKPDQIYLIETDVLIVIRTDKAAGSGGYGGLPPQFSTYKGAMVIVDDPDKIAALSEPGGYLATEYLNDSFVNAIARQVR